MSHVYPTRGEVEELMAARMEELLKVLLQVLAPPGSDVLRTAQQRARELQEHDPAFAAQVAAVQKAREQGAHLTVGADMGYRTGPGVTKIAGPPEENGDGPVGPAQRAVRRRAEARRRNREQQP